MAPEQASKAGTGPNRPKSRFWRLCRIYFRRFRITIWFLVLALLAGLVYVNQIGLPGFVNKPLLEKLRERGIDLQFSRLRLRWYQGIVAENVRFGRPDQPRGPQLTVAEVQIELNRHSLSRLRLQVDGLMLRRGRLLWPIAETNLAARALSVSNIQTELRLLPDDRWELDHFTAGLAGAKISLSGAITNASAVRDWSFFRAQAPTPAGIWEERLRKLADALDATHFSAAPELLLDVRGDARDLQSFRVRMGLNTPGAETPWGAVTQGRFTVRVLPATNDQVSRAELHLHAADAQTPWAATTNLQLTLHINTVRGPPLPVPRGEGWGEGVINASLAVSAGQLETKWGSATNAQLTAHWTQAFTNPIPLSGDAQLQCEGADSQWGRVGKLQLSVHHSTPVLPAPPPSPPRRSLLPPPIWAWWTNLGPYVLDWDCHLIDLQCPKLEAQEILCGGSWRKPELRMTNLHACLYDAQLDARASLNVDTRALAVNLNSDLDPNKVSPLFTESLRRFLAQFSWEKPPDLRAQLSLILPTWTNRHPDWAAEVRPTLRIQGQFQADSGGAYRGVPVLTAQSHFAYSNQAWHLPDLTAARPEGTVLAQHDSSDLTKDFYWRFASTIDPRALRRLLEPDAQRALDLLTFTQPPVIAAEVWGRWRDPARIGVRGRVAVTNFTFRGEAATGFQTALQFTNRQLQLLEPRAQLPNLPPPDPQPSTINHQPPILAAAGLKADFVSDKIYLTNGFSTADPQVVARAISEKVGRTLEPYHFDRPPTVSVKGTIPIHREEDADLHFAVDGGSFRWWKFHPAQIWGQVHWMGQRLVLSDVHSEFYGGRANASASFDFRAKRGAAYEFTLVATNANLHSLIAGLSSPLSPSDGERAGVRGSSVLRTNNLEGMLSGSLVITNANTADAQKVFGYGDLELHDGLIWDIPVFGIFSPMLNAISPGLGNSRANAGICTFVITNGVIRSDDLEIRSPAMRLDYRGTVDLQGRINARVGAELLRDIWGIGPVVSTVFWPFTKMFEYKVTGTLDNPRSEPLYIPKIVQMPFHPFRSFKELLLEDTNTTPTNAPPYFQPTP